MQIVSKIGFNISYKLFWNRLWHFMQIVSKEDSLHEVSKPIF